MRRCIGKLHPHTRSYMGLTQQAGSYYMLYKRFLSLARRLTIVFVISRLNKIFIL